MWHLDLSLILRCHDSARAKRVPWSSKRSRCCIFGLRHNLRDRRSYVDVCWVVPVGERRISLRLRWIVRSLRPQYVHLVYANRLSHHLLSWLTNLLLRCRWLGKLSLESINFALRTILLGCDTLTECTLGIVLKDTARSMASLVNATLLHDAVFS